MTHRFTPFAAAALVVAALFPASTPRAASAIAHESAGVFPVPEGLVHAKDFWTSIYATYTTQQSVIHDNRYLNVVYGVLDFRSMAKGRSEGALDEIIEERTEKEKERIAGLLLELAEYGEQVPFSRLTPEQRRIYDAFEDVEELDKFRAAADRVRAQRGQADKFLLGIAEVAPYIAEMEQIFREKGLPTDLTRLVFVESMFNLRAYSKVGAAGPWQFMSYTGKRFMTINAEIDERMDPIHSTRGAAALLADNYRQLGDWGLALTAYNHGARGMKRAVEAVGSTDIGQIAWNYESRTFGFASRNFYAEFLAARDVYNNRERYFGAAALAALPRRTRTPYDEIVLPDFVAITTFERYCGVSAEDIRELNPALTRYVVKGQKYIPKGYPLRVPAGKGKAVAKAYTKIPSTQRYIAQRPNEYHRVRRGETLARIARKYRMSVDAIVNLNGLSSRNRIRAGQRLRVLPPEKSTSVAVAKAKPEEKKPQVKILPVVRLPEDELVTDLPLEELPDDQEEMLAAAEAPALDDSTALAMAETGAPIPVPEPAGQAPSMAAALTQGSIELAMSAAGVKPATEPIPDAPASEAVAEPAPPESAPSEPAAETGSEAETGAPAAGAVDTATSAIPDTAALVPIRPASAVIPPPRSRADAREGITAPYPGGIRCTLTSAH